MRQRVSAPLGVGSAARRSSSSVTPASRAPSASRRPAVRSSAGSRPQLSTTTAADRSEEHTSELQSLMRISYAVFCLTKKKEKQAHKHDKQRTTTPDDGH